MQANKTVSLNGRLYDAITGLPVDKSPKVSEKPLSPAIVKKRAAALVASSTVHAQPQKSQTLHRRSTKKPGLPKRPQAGRHMDFARSPKVSKFAAHPVAPAPAPAKATVSTPDIAPKPHPVAARALARTAKPVAKAAAPTSKEIKEAAIAAAIAKPAVKSPKKKRFNWRQSRKFAIVSGIFAALLIGAYLTYVNMPSLSVNIAASQAGIKAT